MSFVSSFSVSKAAVGQFTNAWRTLLTRSFHYFPFITRGTEICLESCIRSTISCSLTFPNIFSFAVQPYDENEPCCYGLGISVLPGLRIYPESTDF